MDKKNTIFCDIDGTIFKYRKFEDYTSTPAEPIHSTIEYLKQQKEEGHMIIFTTARPYTLFSHTVWELETHNVYFDRIIMDIERGPRILINDMDPGKDEPRAIAINLVRDKGI
jgi:hypothetical protein